MVERARVQDAAVLASLHMETIFEGFLSKLGVGFLTSLYRYIIQREKVFVYREKGEVIGFVSLSEDAKGMIRRFAFSSPASIFKILFILFKRPSFFFPMLETAMATFLSFFKNSKNSNGKKQQPLLPEAELLSLAVNPDQQSAGIGTELLIVLEKYLRGSKVTEYKVIVGQGLDSANNFYKKHGFVYSTKIRIHGKSVSNVYVKEVEF